MQSQLYKKDRGDRFTFVAPVDGLLISCSQLKHVLLLMLEHVFLFALVRAPSLCLRGSRKWRSGVGFDDGA